MALTTLRGVAQAVARHWTDIVAGDYQPPACPSPQTLAALLAASNYAAGHPEEGRYPRFNVSATSTEESLSEVWRFDYPRPLTIEELRRLIPATDPRKSAVHVEWDADGQLSIVGIHDLGTSWHRARAGLGYAYAGPPTLLIEVERPNRLSIYQRQFRMATFSDSEADMATLDLPLFLHSAANGGLEDLADRIRAPKHESVREYSQFEFIALWNCYAAIANTIGLAGHGGAAIILPSRDDAHSPFLRRKYVMHSPILSNSLVEFLNARHEVGDQYHLRDIGKRLRTGRLAKLEWKLQTALESLVENIRLVARLAECDGAIVMTRSLELLGFGCEIAAELREGAVVCEMRDEMNRQYRELDVEGFGMRHRSALKLASQVPNLVTLVVSQDGPISGIWSDTERVYMRRGVRLVNMNLPWA